MPTETSIADSAATLVAGLQRHLQAQGLAVTRIETHISWVLLAGAFAYKIKKPVRFPFLDCSTLQARRHFCEEEVRLNQRLAGDLYIGVVPIHAGVDGPSFDGDGPVVEVAVKMHRMPPMSLASERIAQGQLTREQLARLAHVLADFHRRAPVAPAGSPYGSARRIVATVAGLLDSLAPHVSAQQAGTLRQWLRQQAASLDAPWRQRQAGGHVREGHGDLHLANVIVWRDTVTAFDCIEFDPVLRWIDVIDDTAFAVMDLWAHGRRDLAFGFLNDYLDASGDHAGLAVLRFYLAARALVRAWVAALRAAAAATPGPDYLALALQLLAPCEGRLLITHGLPGSGKSHVTAGLLAQAGAIRLRSDVERRRLSGPEGRYDPETTERTFAHLAAMARVALRAGFPTIVDAAFLQRAERDRMRELARDEGVPFSILDCRADMATLRERVAARAERGDDPSEADLAVLDKLASIQQPLDATERRLAIELDTGPVLTADRLAGLTRRWLERAR